MMRNERVNSLASRDPITAILRTGRTKMTKVLLRDDTVIEESMEILAVTADVDEPGKWLLSVRLG